MLRLLAAEDGVKARHFKPVLSPIITMNNMNLSKQADAVCTETGYESFDFPIPVISVVGEMRPQ